MSAKDNFHRIAKAYFTTRLEGTLFTKKERGTWCRKMQEKILVRTVIYGKDVMNITGRKPRAAWKLLASIRKKYKKKKGQYITVKEFSQYTGIDEESILPFLR